MNKNEKIFSRIYRNFRFSFCGTGAVVVNSLSSNSLGLLGISAAFGIIIIAMIYIFGSISGAHLNPAVTIGLLAGKKIQGKETVGYIVSQILGAFLASGLLFLIFPESKTLGETIPSGGVFPSFILEFILTFFLMLTILGITSKKENSHLAGIVIGVAVTGIILFAGPISGGSFNPARSLAPAIISNNLHSLWIYMIAPISGSVLAMFTWLYFNNKEN